MVAIVIPTKDRSEFIERQMYFYSNQGCVNKIYIADSSEQRIHIANAKKVIDYFSDKLDITYGHYPKTNIEEAQLLILQEVSDKYSAYCGDDDFLISKSLQECSDFLENNSSYTNCHGRGILFSTSGGPLSGPIVSASEYSLQANELDDPFSRLEEYLSNYWPIWTVRRTDEFKETLTHLRRIPSESFREITMGCLPIIKGKTKLLDNLYVIRQIHEYRFKNPDPLKAMMKEDWLTSYKEMKSILSNELNQNSLRNIEECEEVVEQSFSKYYSQGLEAKIMTRTRESDSFKTIKAFFRRNFKIAYNFYLIFISKELNIQKLKRTSSVYYSEFKQISDFINNYRI